MNEIFDKEEWASRKQQDREAAYAMVDDTLKKMGTNGKAFQTYLDVQSKFERYSVSNALLVAAQKPEATNLGDANFWRGRGGYIRKRESGILLSSTERQTLSTAGGCRSMSTLSWTSLPTWPCRMISTSFLPPCEAGKFPLASSSRIWPS